MVQQDEFEKGERKLLNFGHTLGHALENQYELITRPGHFHWDDLRFIDLGTADWF